MEGIAREERGERELEIVLFVVTSMYLLSSLRSALLVYAYGRV